MPKTPKRPRDLNQWAKRMVDIATGEAIDREPTRRSKAKTPRLWCGVARVALKR